VLKRSGKGLVRAAVPFSPITNNLYPDLFSLIKLLTSLTIVELTAPHNPLSEVIGTHKVFFIDGGYFFFCKYVSLFKNY